MTILFPLIMAVSQFVLGQTVTACPTEGLTETYGNEGTFVGAIAECSEASFGIFIKHDGSVVIEDRR